MSSYREKYFSGNTKPFYFGSKSQPTFDQSDHPNPKGMKDGDSCQPLSNVFGEGLVEECLQHEKPRQTIDK